MDNALTRLSSDFKPKPLPRIDVPKRMAPKNKPPKIAAPGQRKGAY